MAQIRAEIARFGGTYWADDELRGARYVRVTLLRSDKVRTPAAEVSA